MKSPSHLDILSVCELIGKLNSRRHYQRRTYTMKNVSCNNFEEIKRIAQSQNDQDQIIIERLQYDIISQELIITELIRKQIKND